MSNQDCKHEKEGNEKWGTFIPRSFYLKQGMLQVLALEMVYCVYYQSIFNFWWSHSFKLTIDIMLLKFIYMGCMLYDHIIHTRMLTN